MESPVETKVPPFCILVLGDLCGRGAGRSSDRDAPDWRPVRVTPDNMLELGGLKPKCNLRLAGLPDQEISLAFHSLEDFHPDTLFRELSLFAELREARAAAKEGRATGFDIDPVADVNVDVPQADHQAEEVPDTEEGGSPVSSEGLLDAIVAGTESRAGPDTGAMDRELREFVREIVRPHRVESKPDRSAALGSIDAAASSVMRQVMHQQSFQSLESLWRSIVFLLSRVDTSGKVRVYIADVSRAELERDLAEAGDPNRSRLSTLLTEPELGPIASKWALAIGAYSFGSSSDRTSADSVLLTRVGQAARAAGVVWLSEADPWLAGCGSLDANPDPRDWSDPWEGDWAPVRETTQAASLGLSLPRFLVREPYGARSARRCRAFEFEEEPGDGESGCPRALLWGNPAFACGALLAQAFAQSGWGFSTQAVLDLDQVPLAPGESHSDPVPVLTEHQLKPAAAQQLAASGFMPLAAFPYEARIRVGGLHSIAQHPGPFNSWWAV